MLLALDRVFYSNPEEYFQLRRLGDVIMSNEGWLISECKFPNRPSLQSIVDYFSQLLSDVDP